MLLVERITRRNQTLVSIVVISIIGILAYGLMIPWLGIYWDENFFMWVAQTHGVSGLVASLASDRPMLGVLWGLEYSIIGQHLIIWHLFALLTRIGSGLAVLWLFRELWPTRRFAAFAAGVLFVVYPGFLKQPIAFMYQMTFITLIITVVSFVATIKAVRSPVRHMRWLWTGLALVTLALELLFVEYFLGLELFRLLILWYVSAQSSAMPWHKRIRGVITREIPYILVSGVYLYWRVFIFVSVRTATDVNQSILGQFKTLSSIVNIPLQMVRDFFVSAIFAWFAPANKVLSDISPIIWVLSFLLFAVSALLVMGYAHLLLRRSDSDEAPSDGNMARWSVELIVLGLIAAPASIFFVLISGRHAELLTFLDRYTLPMLIPIVLIIVGLLTLMFRPRFQIVALALLVGLSVSTQFANADLYRQEWSRVKDMWWQISWRIPQIQDGSMLVIEDANNTVQIRSDYAVWSDANLIYRPNAQTVTIDGRYLDTTEMNNVLSKHLQSLSLRNIDYTSDYGNAIILVRQDKACLRVIDPDRREFPELASGQLIAVSPYSQINRITTNADSVLLPKSIFGSEPPHTWCYYFQKADLSIQRGAWDQVAKIYDDVKRLKLGPNDKTEWLPFLEAFVRLGDVEHANQIVENSVADIVKSVPLEGTYCTTLARLETVAGIQSSSANAIDAARNKLDCKGS